MTPVFPSLLIPESSKSSQRLRTFFAYAENFPLRRNLSLTILGNKVILGGFERLLTGNYLSVENTGEEREAMMNNSESRARHEQGSAMPPNLSHESMSQ